MQISRLTALIIATRGDDIHTDFGGPTKNGKYVGWITLGPDDRYRPLISSDACFDTGEAAKEAMVKTVAEIRRTINGT